MLFRLFYCFVMGSTFSSFAAQLDINKKELHHKSDQNNIYNSEVIDFRMPSYSGNRSRRNKEKMNNSYILKKYNYLDGTFMLNATHVGKSLDAKKMI